MLFLAIPFLCCSFVETSSCDDYLFDSHNNNILNFFVIAFVVLHCSCQTQKLENSFNRLSVVWNIVIVSWLFTEI